MIYSLNSLGFQEVSRAKFNDIWNLFEQCTGLLEKNNYKFGIELLNAIRELKFSHYKKGAYFLDIDTGEKLIVPCDAICLMYNYETAVVFDKFTSSNPITRAGYMEINTLGNVLGCAVGHYHIREYGGGTIWFID